MDLPAVDGDKATLCLFTHDRSGLPTGADEVYFQCAVLYTNDKGQRMIRVHNSSVPVLRTLSKLFRSSDLEALTNSMAKMASRDVAGWPYCKGERRKAVPLGKVRDAIITRCVDILYVYRQHCATNSSPGQLILPEALKLFPLYVTCLLVIEGLLVT